jgi:sulfur carrier protein ThiS
MRMHRGSSKVARDIAPPAGILPLSASSFVTVYVDVARAGRHAERSIRLALGSLVRDAVRAVGESPEGCAVLIEELPVPLDTPLVDASRLVVLPTFSGG